MEMEYGEHVHLRSVWICPALIASWVSDYDNRTPQRTHLGRE